MAPSPSESATKIGDEWTIVAPRRSRKHKQTTSKSKANDSAEQSQPHEEFQAWAPVDLQIDKDRELKLMQKMEMCMKKLEGSQFFEVLMDQIESPNSQVGDHLSRFRHTEPKMKMVIYGIGSIESSEPSRLQLSLAILLQRKLDWVGEVEVFDPVLSRTDSRVTEALGCSVLSVNEHGRREASRPTLFFMPHCEAVLYNNLLEANWKADRLRNMVMFGNAFGAYEEHVSLVRNDKLTSSRSYILAAQKFTAEIEIKTVTDDYFRAFNESSWHFFSPDSDPGLPVA